MTHVCPSKDIVCGTNKANYCKDCPLLITDLQKTALSLYVAPFRFERGYIFDAKGNIVSDDGDIGDSIARIRGWGRILYMKSPEELQDEIGACIAQALTDFWNKHTTGTKND